MIMNNIDKVLGNANANVVVVVYQFANLWQNYQIDILKYNNEQLSKTKAALEEQNEEYNALPWYKQIFYRHDWTLAYYRQKEASMLDFLDWLTKEAT